MGARWMEQKRAKMKRERRAWAKGFSRPSGIVPNRGVIVQYKETAKGLGVDEHEVEILMLKLYGHGPYLGTPAGKRDVIEKLRELKKIVPEMQFFKVIDNAYWRVRLFYGAPKGEPTRFVLVKDDKRTMRTSTSISYHSKDRALDCWFHQTVRWVEGREYQPTSVAPPEV